MLKSLVAILVLAIIVGSIVAVVHFARIDGSTSSSFGVSNSCIQKNSVGIYAAYASTVYKFNIQTGAIRWKYDTKKPMKPFSVAPTVVGNHVYISSGNALYALDATTGTERWQQQWGSTLPSSDAIPIVLCNTIALVASDNTLHMMDATSGKELWQKPFGTTATIINQLPATTSDVLYTSLSSSNGEQLQALNARNGATLWSTTALTSGDNPSSFRLTEMLVTNNTIYASFSRYNGGGFFRAFDAHNGKLLWSVNLREGYEFSHLQVLNDIAYLTANPVNTRKDVYEEAYTITSGTRLWSFPVGASLVDSPILETTTLTFSTQNGYVYALDARSGHQRWSYHADGAINLTTIDNTTMYVEVGELHVLQGAMGVPPSFTPRAIVALDTAGKELQRYSVPQGLSAQLLTVGNGNVYLVGSSVVQYNQFYNVVAISLANKNVVWQQRIKNFPTTGLFPIVVT